MRNLEVHLEEPMVHRLEEAAQKLGLTPEELLRLSVEEKLAQLDEVFRTAVAHVVSKNAELYKRLA